MSAQFYSPSEAARRLGVSAKALRLYEQRGLVTPVRSAAGWRTYGPDQMRRAGEIAALRALGFSLTQVARVLAGDPNGLEASLAAHQATLEHNMRRLTETTQKVRALRNDAARGAPPSLAELARLSASHSEPVVALDLPWPWGGERFEVRDLKALTYLIGPLGSGKTRLAMKLAEQLPRSVFVGLERTENSGGAARAALDADAGLRDRVERHVAWLAEDGATIDNALIALLVGLEHDAGAIVVDLIEQDLDEATQLALAAHLRRRAETDAAPVIAMTRSCAILDLASVGPREAILYCPANHSAPIWVSAFPGAPGYEGVATCLAPPDVRARTEGMRATMPSAA